MSRRTAEANKAIRLAWQREFELVKEGKGTRDWTEDQQRDILNPELGRAYDENGKAFEGHHMKSAEAYPEYQGNPEIIQFLSRTEHTQAHGEWRKPTNGYYDYITGVTYDFDDDGFTPCKIIELSNPVVTIDIPAVRSEVEMFVQVEKGQSSAIAPPNEVTPTDSDNSIYFSNSNENVPVDQNSRSTVVNGFLNAVNNVKDFSEKHPVLTAVVKVGFSLSVAAITGKVIDTKFKGNSSEAINRGLMNNQTRNAIIDTVVDFGGKFEFKESESLLKKLGYSVAKNAGLSECERQKILQEAVSNGLMSKDEICAFLEKNINLHKNQDSFGSAVGKWISDLAYIKESQ